MVDEPPSADEVDRYRRMLLGHAAMGLQRAYGRAGSSALAELYGIPWGPEALRTSLDGVDVDSVWAAARRVLSNDPLEVLVEPLK